VSDDRPGDEDADDVGESMEGSSHGEFSWLVQTFDDIPATNII